MEARIYDAPETERLIESQHADTTSDVDSTTCSRMICSIFLIIRRLWKCPIRASSVIRVTIFSSAAPL